MRERPKSMVKSTKSAKMELIREKIRANLHRAYEQNARKYNLRTKEVRYVPGQEVFRRNFQQSDFKNNFNAKLAPRFLKCRILRPVGACIHEVTDMNGKSLGNFHAKDLKQ